MYKLEYLSLVGDSSERTVSKAHAAGHTFLLIDISPAELVRAYGFHAAGIGAGTGHPVYGTIGTSLDTFSAFDAGVLIYGGAAIFDGDCLLGAHHGTGMRETALTLIRDLYYIVRTGMTGKFDDIDERRLVILLRLDSLLKTLTHGSHLLGSAQGKTHGKAQTFPYDGALKEDVITVICDLARNEIIRHMSYCLLEILKITVVLIGETGNLCIYLFS